MERVNKFLCWAFGHKGNLYAWIIEDRLVCDRCGYVKATLADSGKE